jgi:hypothetical protein
LKMALLNMHKQYVVTPPPCPPLRFKDELTHLYVLRNCSLFPQYSL